MMEIIMFADSLESVPQVRENALNALKDKMWGEVWRENIDLPQAVVDVQRDDSGRFRITAKI